MELTIDNRESIKSYFEEKNYKWVKFENLDLGDYLFKYKDEPILIIERKSIEDLAIYRALPNMTVMHPCDDYSTQQLTMKLLPEEKRGYYSRSNDNYTLTEEI